MLKVLLFLHRKIISSFKSRANVTQHVFKNLRIVAFLLVCEKYHILHEGKVHTPENKMQSGSNYFLKKLLNMFDFIKMFLFHTKVKKNIFGLNMI